MPVDMAYVVMDIAFQKTQNWLLKRCMRLHAKNVKTSSTLAKTNLVHSKRTSQNFAKTMSLQAERAFGKYLSQQDAAVFSTHWVSNIMLKINIQDRHKVVSMAPLLPFTTIMTQKMCAEILLVCLTNGVKILTVRVKRQCN